MVPDTYATAISTPVVTRATGPKNLDAVPRQKVHRNLVSWKFGIPIARMPQICPCDNVEGFCMLSYSILLDKS
jgi:hypothetical protein